jgi:hypothetical protein
VLQTFRLKSSFSLAELDQLGALLTPLAGSVPEKEFELHAANALVHQWKRALNRPSKTRRRSTAATSASHARSADTSSGPSPLSSLLLAIPILALWAAWIVILVGGTAIAIAALIGVNELRFGLTAVAIVAIIVLFALAD